MLIKNANIHGREGIWDIKIENGKFSKIGNALTADNGEEIIDASGKMVIPPYVDSHVHLDYVCTYGEPRYNMSGTLFEGISIWSERKKTLTKADVKKRARHVIDWEIAHGTQFIRTHVNSDEPGHVSAEALLELRDEVKDLVDLQIVAFPQHGIYNFPDGDKLLEEVVAMGVDAVGAIPHYEDTREDLVNSLYLCFDLAEKYDKLIDVHCDETDDVQSRFLELLNALVLMEGIGKKTTASHTCSFGSADNSYAFKLMKNLKKSGLNFISCPTENIYLQGRQDTYPKRRGLTRVKELFENGINVCFAQDSIQDPWYPLGNGNLMNVLDNGIHIAQMMSFEEIDRCLDLITVNGAKTMNLTNSYGIEAGKPANFIVLDAKNEFEAVSERADVSASIRNGEFLFKKAPVSYEIQNDFMK